MLRWHSLKRRSSSTESASSISSFNGLLMIHNSDEELPIGSSRSLLDTRESGPYEPQLHGRLPVDSPGVQQRERQCPRDARASQLGGRRDHGRGHWLASSSNTIKKCSLLLESAVTVATLDVSCVCHESFV